MNPLEKLLGKACDGCVLCRYARENPETVIGRIMAWHGKCCPAWKAQQKIEHERQLMTQRQIPTSDLHVPESKFPRDGILWRDYDATIVALEERARPVLAFVIDQDGTCWPFLREIFKVMPKNEKLSNLLNGPCVAMLLQADSIPEYMADLGAGSSYHIAILSPSGLTLMKSFSYVTAESEELVKQIADSLEAIARYWD